MNPVTQIPVKTFFETMQENTCHTEIMSNFSEETVTNCYCDRILAETFSDFMITKFSILAKDSFVDKRRLCLWLNASALYIACTINEMSILQYALVEHSIDATKNCIIIAHDDLHQLTEDEEHHYTFIIEEDKTEEIENIIAAMGITYYYI